MPVDRVRVDAVATTSAEPPWRRWLISAWWRIRTAPLTYSWLTVLLLTTFVQLSLSRRRLNLLLVRASTNLHHLATDPIRVLMTSLLWLDNYRLLVYLVVPYIVVFSLVLAPAERWLGPWRWLSVGLLAHVGATYFSEGVLYLEIHHGEAFRHLSNTRDIGVSYFLVGVMGVLTYRIGRRWRWAYLGALLVILAVAFAIKPGFTPIGHLFAFLIGLCCYPLIRGRLSRPRDRAPGSGDRRVSIPRSSTA
jgi:hypothetical protein